MLRLARERPELRVVGDQVGAPTSSRAIAEGTVQVLASLLLDRRFVLPTELNGVYNMTASGETSWHGFASAILASDPRRHEQVCHEVVSISTDQYPTPARRPAYSVLDNGKIARTFGVSLPPWESQLSGVVRQLG
jgi:dTDP-4-dehydrorhamnose reductase